MVYDSTTHTQGDRGIIVTIALWYKIIIRVWAGPFAILRGLNAQFERKRTLANTSMQYAVFPIRADRRFFLKTQDTWVNVSKNCAGARVVTSRSDAGPFWSIYFSMRTVIFDQDDNIKTARLHKTFMIWKTVLKGCAALMYIFRWLEYVLFCSQWVKCLTASWTRVWFRRPRNSSDNLDHTVVDRAESRGQTDYRLQKKERNCPFSKRIETC